MGDMTWLFLQWCKNHMRWFAGIFPCNRNIWGHHSYLLLCIRKASYTMSKQAICGCSDSVEPKWLGNAANRNVTWSAKLESTHAPWLRNGGRPRLLCSCLVPCNEHRRMVLRNRQFIVTLKYYRISSVSSHLNGFEMFSENAWSFVLA